MTIEMLDKILEEIRDDDKNALMDKILFKELFESLMVYKFCLKLLLSSLSSGAGPINTILTTFATGIEVGRRLEVAEMVEKQI